MRVFPPHLRDPKYISLFFLLVLLPVIILSLRGKRLTSQSHASSATAVEAESGVISGNAIKQYDANASGTSPNYVLFGSTTSPSGQSMPTGDLPGWHQIFAEDFLTDAPLGQFKTTYANQFTNYGDGWMGTGNIPSVRRCTPKVVSVANGMMTYFMHQETLPSTDPCSGGTAGTYWLNAVEQPASNGATIKQLYGKYTIRFQVRGTLPGQYMVPLLWPVSENWPYDGEIDFPEGHLEGNICAFLHHQGATSGSDQEAFCPSPGVPFSPGWHTASTEWASASATFILDGNIIGHSTTRVPDTTMRYVLQSETCIGGVCPADGTSANIDFDWVVIYSAL